jgi:ribonuclease HI
MKCRLPVFYVDGQSMGNEQKTLPRRAKIVVAYKEKPNSAFQIRWEEIGDRTNNEAEYIALLKALGIIESKWGAAGEASGKGAEPIKIHSDSMLIVNQVRGSYEVTDVKLRQLCDNVKALMKKMSAVKLEWIPREENFAGQWLEDRWKGGKVEVVKDEDPNVPVAKV